MRERWRDDQVKWIYYSILGAYVTWTFIAAYVFSKYGTPKLMTLIIANLNNLALGATSFQVLWVNRTLLPRELRPGWIQQCGLIGCGVFNLGMAALVFVTKQVPIFLEWWGR